MDFNTTKDTYRDTVNRTIAFTGKNLDFFSRTKAQILLRILADELPGSDHPLVLDVGCGHGYIHADLGRHGVRVVGVEVANDVLQVARAENPGASYVCSEGEHLPFVDGSVDVVLAICVMHHVPPGQWPMFMAALHRVLRPGGIAVVFEHNPLNPVTQYIVATNHIDDDATLLSGRTTRRLFRTASFEDVKTRSIFFTPFEGRIFRYLDEALGPVPFGAQYYTIGRVR